MEQSSNEAAEASTSTESRKTAPARDLPTTHFYSIEYPGYIRPESASKAVHSLGGQSSIDRAFRRNAPREDSLLELNLRPDNPFSHPLPGDLVPTNNLLLKVVKRKLKRPPLPIDDDGRSHNEGEQEQEVVGEYTAVAIGVIPKTARFRSEQIYSFTPPALCRLKRGVFPWCQGMADFQYQPPQEDPLSKLRRAMTALDG
jgi:general transcription factor 3C polypeptide 5 (transcription factor C subunit 1)